MGRSSFLSEFECFLQNREFKVNHDVIGGALRSMLRRSDDLAAVR
jgi:hypothetical protein